MNNKAGFCPHIYPDWIELFKALNDKQRSDVLMAIATYPNNAPVENNPVWGFIKLQLDKEYQVYSDRCDKNREIANARWRKEENANGCERIQTDTKKCERMPITGTEYKQEYKLEKEIVKEKGANASQRFNKPTLEEIKTHLKEKNYTFSAEQFYAYYESNGWMVGKNKMKDWRSACVTWQVREKQPNHANDDEEKRKTEFLKKIGAM